MTKRRIYIVEEGRDRGGEFGSLSLHLISMTPKNIVSSIWTDSKKGSIEKAIWENPL